MLDKALAKRPRINACYELLEPLGVGGMGHVYRARQVSLGREVAVKLLLDEHSEDPQIIQRFVSEACAIAELSHDNIVNIYDFGTSDDGAPFIAMELLRGQTLVDVLDREGRLDWPRTRSFVNQAASALGAAHQRGIVHRDMKPSNCMIITMPDGQERLKLLDFGIAKRIHGAGVSVKTETGIIVGSSRYMAPEQWLGDSIDATTDIYALGLLIYQLLAGEVAFSADNLAELAAKHLRDDVPELTLAQVPYEINAVIRRATQKRRQDRYANMEELRSAVLAIDLSLVPDATDRLITPVERNRASHSTLAPTSTRSGELDTSPGDVRPSDIDVRDELEKTRSGKSVIISKSSPPPTHASLRAGAPRRAAGDSPAKTHVTIDQAAPQTLPQKSPKRRLSLVLTLVAVAIALLGSSFVTARTAWRQGDVDEPNSGAEVQASVVLPAAPPLTPDLPPESQPSLTPAFRPSVTPVLTRALTPVLTRALTPVLARALTSEFAPEATRTAALQDGQEEKPEPSNKKAGAIKKGNLIKVNFYTDEWGNLEVRVGTRKPFTISKGFPVEVRLKPGEYDVLVRSDPTKDWVRRSPKLDINKHQTVKL
jgi:serine/threonine protein kinase